MPVDLTRFSDSELCWIIGAILARPGDPDFTAQELDELAAINAEFVRREERKKQ